MEGVGREGEGKVNSAALHCNTLVSGVDAGFSYRGGTKRPTHNHTHILCVWLRVCISHACMKVVIEQKGSSESAELDGLYVGPWTTMDNLQDPRDTQWHRASRTF